MGVIKKFNPITEEWEIYGSTDAKDINLIDVGNNFEEKNVEGALREISDKLDKTLADITAQKGALAKHSSYIAKHSSDIEWLKENGGGGSGGGGGAAAPTLTSTFEGAPNVVSEALIAGCVMAVTKFDAWEDAIDEGRCGMAVPINNVDAIADMYVQLCTHSDLMQLSHNAYQYALRNYDMEAIVAKLYEMLFGGDFI